MADKTFEVIYGGGAQTLSFVIPQWPAGPPTSPTCKVYDARKSMDETSEFDPTVTVDPVSTTFDAASGVSQSDPTLASIAATTNTVIGTPLLAENEDGQKELVTPKAINSGDSLVLENPLTWDYAAGSSTLKGVTLSFPTDATWTNTESKLTPPNHPGYKAVISYTVNSIVRKHYLYLKLVRQAFAYNVQLKDLQKYWPDFGLEEGRHERGDSAQGIISAAADLVRADILALPGYEPHRVYDSEIVNLLVIHKTLWVMCAHRGKAPGGWTPGEYMPVIAKLYDSLFQKHLGTTNHHVHTSDTTEGDSSTKPRTGLFFGS